MRIDKVLTLALTEPVAVVPSLRPATATTSATAPTPTTITAAAPLLPLDTTATGSDDLSVPFSDDSTNACTYTIRSNAETYVSIEYNTDEDNANFFTLLAVANFDGELEDVVFVDTYLLALKEKDKFASEKGTQVLQVQRTKHKIVQANTRSLPPTLHPSKDQDASSSLAYST